MDILGSSTKRVYETKLCAHIQYQAQITPYISREENQWRTSPAQKRKRGTTFPVRNARRKVMQKGSFPPSRKFSAGKISQLGKFRGSSSMRRYFWLVWTLLHNNTTIPRAYLRHTAQHPAQSQRNVSVAGVAGKLSSFKRMQGLLEWFVLLWVVTHNETAFWPIFHHPQQKIHSKPDNARIHWKEWEWDDYPKHFSATCEALN